MARMLRQWWRRSLKWDGSVVNGRPTTGGADEIPLRVGRFDAIKSMEPGSALSLVWCFFFVLLVSSGLRRLCRGGGFEHEQTDSLDLHCPHHRSLRSKLYIIHQPSPGSSEHARTYDQKIISESKTLLPLPPFPRLTTIVNHRHQIVFYLQIWLSLSSSITRAGSITALIMHNHPCGGLGISKCHPESC